MINGLELHSTWPRLAFPKVFSQEFRQVLSNFPNTIFKNHFFWLLLYVFQTH